MELVIVESPYAGNVDRNVWYARMCLRDCLLRNESPYASHLLFTQEGILNDDIPHERELGIEAGLLWGMHADKTVVYVDYGITGGMRYGIERARKEGRKIEFRSILKYSKPYTLSKEEIKWLYSLPDHMTEQEWMSR